ncbi:hypothetical protein MTHERMOG20_25330 [Moorella thermoacetica]|uniref:DGC domain protein n=3 Tax=Neomoorella thermoacetica TaxID=1525 RepID=A0A1J5NPV9_NEOTH|nr:putative zinc-binding protein [Moorella thermoacetica]AKX95062.1 DGC domain protein [Moorella thermoacetica]AKX97688.1 DGC domain protein [Moorella thermoacetica]OIQ09188.1 DGC domain protein [Moorella thermoacetica]OIQ10776.1 DGC domain protein [Moorella thermoacetica]OIQ53901.1 DGC domain protein [Moorella thermoacetica]
MPVNSSRKVYVIPCSGIGKMYGLLGREAVLKTVKELRPDKAATMCLALLVYGDNEARKEIAGARCITVDGCPKLCAAKNVEHAGGRVVEMIRAVDAFRNHRGVDAGTAAHLTAAGWQIADELAADLAGKVDRWYDAGEEQ